MGSRIKGIEETTGIVVVFLVELVQHFLSLLSQKYLKAERELHPERGVSDDGDYVTPASKA